METILYFAENRSVAQLLFHHIAEELMETLTRYDYKNNRLIVTSTAGGLSGVVTSRLKGLRELNMIEMYKFDLFNPEEKNANYLMNLLLCRYPKRDQYSVIVNMVKSNILFIIAIDDGNEEDDSDFSVKFIVSDDKMNSLDYTELDDDMKQWFDVIMTSSKQLFSKLAGERVDVKMIRNRLIEMEEQQMDEIKSLIKDIIGKLEKHIAEAGDETDKDTEEPTNESDQT